jgi:hypothetical protein
MVRAELSVEQMAQRLAVVYGDVLEPALVT